MEKRIVITGIGPITANGAGKDNFWKSLINKELINKKIPSEYELNYKFRSKYFVPFPDLTEASTAIPAKYNLIMDGAAKIAVCCADLAIKDSGLSESAIKNANIVMGVGISGLYNSFESHVAHRFSEENDLVEKYNLTKRYNRMVVPMQMPNSVSSWISIIFGITATNFTVNTACSSGNYALGEAYQKIKHGYADVCISGGVEHMQDPTGSIMRAFDSLGTLTTAEDGIPQPFSKNRSGFLFSEGAGCVLILEEYEHAVKRGADIYAEIGGFESCSDAYNIVLIEPSGEGIKKMICKAIGNVKIDYINAHGTGTQLNENVESKVLTEIFGSKENQPVINSTKSILGHSIGASAALEAAACCLSIKNSEIHPNLSSENIEELNIAEELIKTNVNTAISTSYGFGGHNSVLLLKKV